MTDTYRNGGKYSPFFRRRLCFWTLRMPFQPISRMNFHTSRLSVSSSTRLAIFKYMDDLGHISADWVRKVRFA